MLKASIIGNLGNDPELRYSANGAPFLRFNVAANGRVKAQDGSWQEETTWVRVTITGQRAESLSQYLKKGTKVYVDGRLEARPWTDNRGEVKAGLEVMANEVQFMSARDDNGGEQRQPVPAGRQITPAEAQRMDDAGDLPF